MKNLAVILLLLILGLVTTACSDGGKDTIAPPRQCTPDNDVVQ